ncbi:MAG: dihydrofolate reductase [Methanomassiliicoccus sp.]|nr:dihydrofolate reductase [Methanomassiliicoccus sp.]
MAETRRIVLYLAASLDGFIARRDGGIDWLPAMGKEDYGYAQFLSGVDAVVMGRITYEQVLTLGPYPYAGKKGYVFTTARRGRDDNVEFVGGDIQTFVDGLRSSPGKDIWLVGGARLAQGFLRAGAVDRMILTIVPHLLGEGIPLFDGGPEGPLVLMESRTFRDGLVQLRYEFEAQSLTREWPSAPGP